LSKLFATKTSTLTLLTAALKVFTKPFKKLKRMMTSIRKSFNPVNKMK
jgi:hypothetical protein